MKIKQFHIYCLLLIICGLSAVPKLSAQTFYALQIDRNLRFKAIDITAEYQPRLVMGTDQALQFQQTVARFLVKKREIEENVDLSPTAKYKLLKRLSSRETAEMGQVLEDYRLLEYRKIKPLIQPLPRPVAARKGIIADSGTTNR